MSDLALFDMAMNEGSPGDQRDAGAAARGGRLAERLIDTSLGDLRYLQELDAAFAPGPGRHFDRGIAVLLRTIYEEWARSAEAILQRVRRVARDNSVVVVGADRLRDEHGRIMAMLSISLDELDEARAQVRRGETVGIEEVRRELRAASGH